MEIDSRRFSVPLDCPLSTARGEIDHREGVLIRIREGNYAGVGEAAPLPGWTESIEECTTAIEAGCDRLAEDGIDATLPEPDRRPAARHALSLALVDRRAREAGEPLYRWLGRDERVEDVAVNATVGDGSSAESARRAVDAVERGFDCLKVKVGARSLDADADRLDAVREAVGPDVELRADANGAWTRPDAEEALATIADHDVSYVEQPLPADDLAGHADLRGGPVDVALDETVGTTSVEAILDADAADVLVLKPMVLGGPDRAREAAVRALEAGVTPVVTTTVDAVVARTAAVHVAASLPGLPPCGLATADRLERDLAPDPAPIDDGRASVPQSNGTGTLGPWEESHA